MKRITSLKSAVFLSVLALGIVAGVLANPTLTPGVLTSLGPPGDVKGELVK